MANTRYGALLAANQIRKRQETQNNEGGKKKHWRSVNIVPFKNRDGTYPILPPNYDPRYQMSSENGGQMWKRPKKRR